MSPHVFRIIAAIDLALRETYCLAGTTAVNGNRWATGSETPPPAGYPVAKATPQGFVIVEDPAITGPVKLGLPVAMNLSLALPPDAHLPDDHPLAVATRVLAEMMVVVVAAGNWGRKQGKDTLSPLARLPWTLAVGATADEQGTELHEYSPASLPGSNGPDVVAYGTSPFVYEEASEGQGFGFMVWGDTVEPETKLYGTSFAAPRVVDELQMMYSFVASVYEERMKLEGQFGGIDLPVTFMIDWGMPFGPQPSSVPALPLNAVNVDSLERLQYWSKKLRSQPLFTTPTRDAISALLLWSARPIPHYERHEIGYGFVGDSTTTAFLCSMSALRLLEITLGQPFVVQLPSKAAKELDSSPLLNPAIESQILQLWRSAGVHWYFNLNNAGISGWGLCPENIDASDKTIDRSWSDERYWPDHLSG